MKIKTLVIAPYRGLKELSTLLAQEDPDLAITVRQGDLDEAIPLVKQAELDGYEIIISRGGTARLIKKHTTLPVIEIPVSGYDILRTITLVKDYKAKVHMIGFPNVCQGVVAVSNLLDTQIPYTVVHHPREVEEAILRAKQDGIQVIVGDTITVRLAQEHGLQGIMITSGKESVLESFSIAKKIYRILSESKYKNSMYEALFEKLPEGVAIVSKDDQLLYANRLFYLWAGVPEHIQKGVPLSQIIPFNIYDNQNLIDAIELNNQMFTIHYGPIDNEIGDEHRFIRIHPKQKSPEDIELYCSKPNPSYYQLLGIPNETILMAREEFQRKKLLIITGEEGTGKRRLAQDLFTSGATQESVFLTICIHHESNVGIEKIKELLHRREQLPIYINGLENLKLQTQENLVPLLTQTTKSITIVFQENPKKLVENKRLSAVFYKCLCQKSVNLSPLRNRVEYLDEYIRSLLGIYNEKYGNQIVGIRPEVLEILHARPWRRNDEELREVIEQLVLNSKGEFIDPSQVGDILNKCYFGRENTTSEDSSEIRIHLEQSLEDIEREIIEMVLKEEGMNQTRAAKRLGINRSTLWRKLKINTSEE